MNWVPSALSSQTAICGPKSGWLGSNVQPVSPSGAKAVGLERVVEDGTGAGGRGSAQRRQEASARYRNRRARHIIRARGRPSGCRSTSWTPSSCCFGEESAGRALGVHLRGGDRLARGRRHDDVGVLLGPRLLGLVADDAIDDVVVLVVPFLATVGDRLDQLVLLDGAGVHDLALLDDALVRRLDRRAPGSRRRRTRTDRPASGGRDRRSRRSDRARG